MSSPKDCVQVNDSSNRLVIMIVIRLQSVHTYDITRYITRMGEPMHQSTWILHPLMHKKKEEVCLCNLKIKKPMHRRGISIVIHIAMSSIYEHCIIAVMCLGCSCDRKVWAVGLDHNRSPMGLWGCDKGVRDCLYVCAQRAKERRRGASVDASEHAGVHNVIGVLVMIGLNGWKSAESSCIQPDKRARGVNR